MTYTYDVFDRRIAQSIDDDGPGGDAPQVTHFAYHGAHVWSDHDAEGNVTARYLYTGNLDQILARHRPGEGTVWYLTDHLGTVRDITDSTGAVINHLAYDAFGQILTQTAPEFGDRYTYTAREYDPALGQYYYRARIYDPRAGRFTAEDPIRFAAGDPNLYRYVGNSPLNWTAPWGHDAMENAVIVRLGPVGALTLNSFSNCFVLSAVSARATSMGIELARTALGSPPTYTERVLSADLDFVVSAISCLFPPSAMSNAGSGAVAVALMAAMQRGVALGAAGQVVILTTPNVVAYAVKGGGSDEGGGIAGGKDAGSPKETATELARRLGREGEEAAGIGQIPKRKIPSVTRPGRYRIPDELTDVTLREIKNVARLSNTSQLRDFLAHAQLTGRTFILETRAYTRISEPLQELIDEGLVIHKIIGQ